MGRRDDDANLPGSKANESKEQIEAGKLFRHHSMRYNVPYRLRHAELLVNDGVSYGHDGEPQEGFLGTQVRSAGASRDVN